LFPAVIDEYIRPKDIAQARGALAGYAPGDAIFIAGGQSLMQAIKSRMVRPRCVIDLQDVAELKGIERGNGLTIGAMTRYVEIAEDRDLSGGYAALRDAAQHVGDRQVRNRGTIGGSICWNYVASCMPCVVLGLGASMNLIAADGKRRQIRAEEFLLGPLETARAPEELLVSISVPKLGANSGSAYKKWGLVTDALPVVGVCVLVILDSAGKCRSARVSLAGLSAGAHRAKAAERVLQGGNGSESEIKDAFAQAAAAADTQSDKWADDSYRRQLIRTLGFEVATSAFARARGTVQGVAK